MRTITGSNASQLLKGDNYDNAIYAYGGNDDLYGYGGNDALFGDAGNDYIVAAAGNDLLYGGAGNDLLYGGSGGDLLEGGSGRDYLYGGAGMDVFLFKEAPRTGIDAIMDFTSADFIALDNNAYFRKVGANGYLKSSAFWSNNTGSAHDSSDRVIYDRDSGRLYYDADGTGPAAKECFASIKPYLNLTYHDFYVF